LEKRGIRDNDRYPNRAGVHDIYISMTELQTTSA
jgi:hypothetical protein